MRKLPRKIKNTWNGFSSVLRKEAKLSALGAGVFATGLTVAVAASGGLVAGVGFLGAIYGFGRMISGLPGFIQEIRHGQEKVTWKNAMGQTVESTQSQQRDLQAFEAIIHPPHRAPGGYPTVGRHSLKMARFNAVAAHAAVVKDIEGGNGTFRFHPVFKPAA